MPRPSALGARGRSLAAALALGLSVFAWAPDSAGAASWERPAQRGAVRPAPLAGVRARGPIADTARSRPTARSASHAPARVESFTDRHGHRLRIGTSIDGISLEPVAALLAATIHGDEVEYLRVKVVPRAEVDAECGGEDVVACYAADALGRSGEMVVPHDTPDTAHAVVHEYGHHLDAGLWNLAPLGLCGLSNDGSRRWFFERQVADNIIDETGCDVDTRWDRLLGEVFAEDFVALNGMDEWVLPDIAPPGPRVLRALSADIERPFEPTIRRARGRLSRGRAVSRGFRLRTWSFVTATLNGTPSADLDLFVFRRGSRRPLERSVRRRSAERIRTALPPGSYDLDVFAQRGRGSYRLSLALE